MFRVDLKALLELSKSEQETLQFHKRIQGAGKVSYVVCYELRDGILTIQRVRRIKMRGRKRPRRHLAALERPEQVSVMSQTSTRQGAAPTPKISEMAIQTLSLDRNHISVDTLDLSLKISRFQQTIIRHFFTTGSQTRYTKLEVRSTQIDCSTKSKCTQTILLPCIPIAASTQTMEQVACRHSSTQTSSAEDELALLSPYLELMHTLLRFSSNHGQLLLGCLQSIGQLVDFKHLELQKQRMDAAIKLDEEANKVPPNEALMKPKKLPKIKQLYCKRVRWRCKRCCCRHRQIKLATPTVKQEQESQTETELTPTECNWTQTKVAAYLVAATQTDKLERDKEKGFLWLHLKK